jgi:serine/threonine protein kinase
MDSRFDTDSRKRTVTCQTCGTVYEAGAKFCGKDGTILEGAKPSQAMNTTMMPSGTVARPKVCPTCKMTYPEYAQFCPNDSNKLISMSAFHQQIAGGGTPAAMQPEPQRQAPQQHHQPQSGDTDADWLAPSQPDVIGKTIAGKYRIDALLGEGGMAQVFKATHLSIEKPVVIKLMHGTLPQMQNAVKRFEMECKVTAKLNHPNLVSVFDGGTLEPSKRPFLVMEFINGESLREKISREGPMSFATAATIMMQVCAGLHEAHSEGVIHRDLKPENIMLRDRADRPDWVKIVDFGIAHLKHGGQKLTATGIAVGTVDYMSPEYLSDKPIDARADIYALGVIFYELLTGRCPFQAESAEGTMAKHLWSNAQPPSHYRQDLKPGSKFDQICEKSLEKDPDKRYQTTLQMKSDLQKALGNLDELWK